MLTDFLDLLSSLASGFYRVAIEPILPELQAFAASTLAKVLEACVEAVLEYATGAPS